MANKSIKELAAEIAGGARKAQETAKESQAALGKSLADAARRAQESVAAFDAFAERCYQALNEAKNEFMRYGFKPMLHRAETAPDVFTVGSVGYGWSAMLSVRLPTEDGREISWQIGFARPLTDVVDGKRVFASRLIACTNRGIHNICGEPSDGHQKEWELDRVTDMMQAVLDSYQPPK